KVTSDFEQLAFNTAISQMMIFVNAVYKADSCPKEFEEGIIKALSPITPHICEEIWEKLGHNDTIAFESWPTYDESKCVDDEIEIAVQINGKVREKLVVAAEAESDEVLAAAKALEKIAEAIDGKTVVKELYVKGRLVNIVVR
ncbi:MAG: class I tRNA ligase family protein, partial [Oscillospiraceae bacterium]|nr:class I tRNA ligase family protein [Oscillospiraceae bacterium]